MPRTPKHIGETLDQLIRDLGMEKQIEQIRVVNLWAELVGENIAKIARADRVDEGILYVKVSSMTWRTELMFQKQVILKRIGERVGEGVIREIRFF